MKTKTTPARFRYTILKQLCNLIPPHLVSRLAKEHQVEEKSRTFSPWSHVLALMFAQVSRACGLNDVCDALRMHGAALSTLRGATPPSRNNFSNSNKVRPASMAEALFWKVLDHLGNQSPAFVKGKIRSGYLRRFRCAIHAVDSTVIHLVANCMDWAAHRRRKAAAKCHVRLNLQCFLPSCVVVDRARPHDNTKARELCAGLKKHEIALFDMAYLDLEHLLDLTERGVWWVTRLRETLRYRVVKKNRATDNPRVLKDQIIELCGKKGAKLYPQRLRLVVALVEVDGKEVEMSFLTNHMEWSGWTVAELYRARWDIEVFFREIKQTLQLTDFLGNNANAVHWQIWTALLVHLLMRYLAHLSKWAHSFTRLFCVVRACLWARWNLLETLKSYGTAKPPGRICGRPEQAYLPHFA